MKIAGSHYAIQEDDYDDGADDVTAPLENSSLPERSRSSGSRSTISTKQSTSFPKALRRRERDVQADQQQQGQQQEENNPSLTATDDEFSFQSHPSQDSSFELDDDDVTATSQDKATRREFAGATIAGAVAGLVLGGPLGAVAVAASSAYAVRSNSPAGSLVRKGGESMARVGDTVLHTERGEATMARAREFLEESRVLKTLQNKKYKNKTNAGGKGNKNNKFRRRALCCAALWSGDGGGSSFVEESVDDSDEAFSFSNDDEDASLPVPIVDNRRALA